MLVLKIAGGILLAFLIFIVVVALIATLAAGPS